MEGGTTGRLRWSGATRNWKLKDEVWLNPERAEPELLKLAA